MPSRKLEFKSSLRGDRKPLIWQQTEWFEAYEDVPPTEVKDGAVAKYINCYGVGTGVKCRNGTYKWTDTKFPPMGACTLRQGYTLVKERSGGKNVVRSLSGDIFEQLDVGNLIGWDNGLYDEIIRYRTPTEVWVRDSDPQVGNTNCHIRGKLNLWAWHDTKQFALVQLAQDFYLVNREHTQYVHVPVINAERPTNGISSYVIDQDMFLVENSMGLYRVIIDEDPPIAYKTNAAIPSQRIISNDDQGERENLYRYFFSMSRLARGTNFRNRETVRVFTESGLNAIDEDRRDWALVYTDDPIGDASESYGVLEGAALGARTNPAAWVEDDGTFRININNRGEQNILNDFTGVVDMYDVATVIQTNLRVYFPSATCEYLGDRANPCLRITSGRVANGDISYVRAGIGGTNIAAVMACRAVDGAQLTNPPVDSQNIVSDLNVPQVPYTEIDDREWHWTHFSVYRTGNTKGTHKNVKGNDVPNSKDDVIWLKDLRVAGSFLARIVDGYIEARYGEFEEADVGSVVEFEDGSRIEIAEYINPQLVRFNDDYYYDYGITDWMAAAIGNGRVIRARQNGHTVTRVEGGVFSSADERRPVFWPDGSQGIIRCVVNQRTAIMWDETDRTETGLTIAPTYRNFCDITNDDKLYTHASAWKSKNRFMEPIPRGNLVSMQPGYVLTAVRGGNQIYYCSLEASYRQFIGYAVLAYQVIEMDDQVLEIIGFPLQFSALCQATTWTGTTNNAQLLTLPETGQLIPIISSLDKIANIGLGNWGSVQFIEDDLIRFVTNTGEVRDFNGREFGPDLTTDKETGEPKFQKAIKDAYKQFTSLYTRELGYLLWWKR